jgi:hypothetical protein
MEGGEMLDTYKHIEVEKALRSASKWCERQELPEVNIVQKIANAHIEAGTVVKQWAHDANSKPVAEEVK